MVYGWSVYVGLNQLIMGMCMNIMRCTTHNMYFDADMEACSVCSLNGILGVEDDSNFVPFAMAANKAMMEDAIRCECGSDTVGSGGHSVWCPKYV